LSFIFCIGSYKAQVPAKIKFKKNPSLIYFFQKGVASDTISKNKSNQFYLIVPDSLKESTVVLIDNAQLLLNKNDSLVNIHYMAGFQYENIYTVKETLESSIKKIKHYEFKSLINGTSALPLPVIKIRILNKKEDEIILENTFFYKEI
jgi:hypothetical protein